ncbi:MAG TPA: tyrosine--tRNA ligase [Chitinophagaceae bacterium]|nr:tyrosine--tRNA ligase [Chitinophagaceae bacterium]HMZ46142.1 tyrosine--tRNA ligase [Chitinophagaceae bacterium]HNF30395.1 tyrosine--tRNA ligase [Chitinophagaceae bacterium]HNM33407.1 tyrosine--tRNA ligase [Chitinophagaceae bacterium]
MNLIEELRWRGMIADIMPGTEEQLVKEMTTGYVGFDPTAESLHIGSLVPIILLVHMQKSGHKPMALIGGATGMIGDPTGKSDERNLLSEETLQKNIEGIQSQLKQFISFDDEKPNAAILVNNYDWFKNISFIDFLRDTGKHITINYMMAKDSVKKRIEGENGISYTEFAYQLMQGYDFYWLYKNKNCKLQFGGSDQWGNMTTGSELIRRMCGGEAFVFTCPLITKADGGKFGKTEGGNVWLSADKTTPYQFYQFWLNTSDADAEKWIKIFTFLTKEEINSLIIQHQQNASDRVLQKTLAKEVTIFVHGENEYEKAVETTQKLFANANAPIESLSVDDLENMEGVQKIKLDLHNLKQGMDIISFLADSSILASKGEARKMLQNGGISINRQKISDVQFIVQNSLLLHQKYLLVQKGKKNYYLVSFE